MKKGIDRRAWEDIDTKPIVKTKPRVFIHIPLDRKYLGMTKKERIKMYKGENK
ncbi:MAG: hypothetical protein IJH63_12680 [Methanobrevibacter sp.]|nr:hypothetical protein [Romboutsia sp.]MBR0371545.1 hypothetical protein [Methanobrevibacter sp.]